MTLKLTAVAFAAAAIALLGMSSNARPLQPLAKQSQANTVPASGHAHVLPPSARPLGKTYSEWAVLWHQWVWTLPFTAHPFFAGGSGCDTTHTGPYRFLGGAFDAESAVRSCTVPTGTTLIFPLINSVWISTPLDPPETRTVEYARAAAECTDARIELAVDDVPVQDPLRYLERSEIFSLTVPTGDSLLGAFGLDPGLVLTPNADFGYYVAIPPLSPGVHKIAWRASAQCFFGPLSQDFLYYLDVQPRGRTR